MTNEKEKGATSFESAPQGNTYAENSTASVRERGIYNPLTWRPEKPPRFRGKSKRRTRADAIARKRGERGHAHPGLLAWLVAITLVWLLTEVAR